MSRSKRRRTHRGGTPVTAQGVRTNEPRPTASFGALLLRARQERGIAHDDVARETRVPKRFLLALENESISSLPGGLYNRAYLRTYAVYLGLDADSLLRDYDRTVQEQTDSRGLATEPDQFAALQAVIQQRESQSARGQAGFQTARGRLIVSGIAVVVLAAGVWMGARHLTLPAQLSLASFSTPTVLVSDTRPNGGRITQSAVASLPLAAPVPPAPESQAEPEPPRPVAAPVPAIVQEGAQVARTEERQASTPISVNDSGVGTDVVGRELIGRAETFAVGARVVFWTQVIGGRAGDTIRHVWFHEGRPVATVTLPVGGASWRTKSQRTLVPGADGEWRVEARAEDGRVLAEHKFRCAL
jgi:cytoskeletal protein RodZ